MSNDKGNKDTSEYFSPEAPQTREYAEERESEPDDRLQPGAVHGTPEPTGRPAFEKDEVG